MSIRQMLVRNKADDTLYQSELALTDPEIRASRDLLEKLLHEDFVETGSSGETYDRETMIEMMVTEAPGEVIIRDFATSFLSEDVALVTYRSIGTSGQEARRTSLWLHRDDRWQLRHHQGTRVIDRWGKVG